MKIIPLMIGTGFVLIITVAALVWLAQSFIAACMRAHAREKDLEKIQEAFVTWCLKRIEVKMLIIEPTPEALSPWIAKKIEETWYPTFINETRLHLDHDMCQKAQQVIVEHLIKEMLALQESRKKVS
ncbi:MAG: hypothetical protein LRY46_01160 [Candidatus Pacebacteria bacterium]|nr:hypothetical protein [Candidatus Paceibacterota bacterium]MCD8508394.1 hypothetical protein [Candidatus Paceibacterota bacterium]MCD8563709.1 hypothetical protein [Candidatus Paceibacterota bacterium]